MATSASIDSAFFSSVGEMTEEVLAIVCCINLDCSPENSEVSDIPFTSSRNCASCIKPCIDGID